jgi:predicted DNA-binding ribbon-helix-helix protein
MSGLVKRSFSLAGHRTSVALEPEFWQALETCAAARGVTMARLVVEIDQERGTERPLASALRIFALLWRS